ncbi:sulfite oxidase heme-binding subunit YedZ [Thalassospira sp.]|uniref:sulfite oxidase heme-binding subunit YedZ n=1 Tax=Thalassospira sp. TaxID=1912094 RepID=UPI0027345B63|nr:protein-methionine-sulfoxide reductase heme-binding subunit MsrQ [Thalassospira sp.]MDP2696993.1 protein-methionine-sulfoxide reductase heme-binding subunit MsrQ [Thalassospira sp.]
MFPWCDPSGRFSVFKFLVFAGLLVPGAFIFWRVMTADGGVEPIKTAILDSGDWTIRFLLLSLLITPLRRVTRWGQVMLVRRMVGLAAMGYGLCHLMLYAATQSWDIARIASEIVLRIYLTIGFVALFGLVVLGVTSTRGMMRRMGKNWGRLHRASYGIAVLGILHFFMQSKIDVSEATLMAGLFVALMACRLVVHLGGSLRRPLVMAGIALSAGLITVGIEYAWYGLATGIPPEIVVAANLDFIWPLRPAWLVFFAGLAMVAIALWKAMQDRGGMMTATSGWIKMIRLRRWRAV